ncbi:MAG: glycosyltransferase [Synergistaceae bacterium]|nr:glycosyltransferase [Synergistaceae bacterium]
MSNKPKIPYSVLMGLYHKDSPEFLRVAIDSMLNQTIPPEEYMIAVDGPIGKELQLVLNDYVKRYPEVFTIHYHPVNRGVGAILGEVLPLCRNEFIVRMDADDYSVPKRVEKELAVFAEHPNLGWVGSNVDEFIDDMKNPVSHVIMPETNEDILKFGRKRCPFRQSSVVFKKSVVVVAGGYRNV